MIKLWEINQWALSVKEAISSVHYEKDFHNNWWIGSIITNKLVSPLRITQNVSAGLQSDISKQFGKNIKPINHTS